MEMNIIERNQIIDRLEKIGATAFYFMQCGLKVPTQPVWWTNIRILTFGWTRGRIRR